MIQECDEPPTKPEYSFSRIFGHVSLDGNESSLDSIPITPHPTPEPNPPTPVEPANDYDFSRSFDHVSLNGNEPSMESIPITPQPTPEPPTTSTPPTSTPAKPTITPTKDREPTIQLPFNLSLKETPEISKALTTSKWMEPQIDDKTGDIVMRPRKSHSSHKVPKATIANDPAVFRESFFGANELTIKRIQSLESVEFGESCSSCSEDEEEKSQSKRPRTSKDLSSPKNKAKLPTRGKVYPPCAKDTKVKKQSVKRDPKPSTQVSFDVTSGKIEPIKQVKEVFGRKLVKGFDEGDPSYALTEKSETNELRIHRNFTIPTPSSKSPDMTRRPTKMTKSQAKAAKEASFHELMRDIQKSLAKKPPTLKDAFHECKPAPTYDVTDVLTQVDFYNTTGTKDFNHYFRQYAYIPIMISIFTILALTRPYYMTIINISLSTLLLWTLKVLNKFSFITSCAIIVIVATIALMLTFAICDYRDFHNKLIKYPRKIISNFSS